MGLVCFLASEDIKQKKEKKRGRVTNKELCQVVYGIVINNFIHK